jgi:hypothetical protein
MHLAHLVGIDWIRDGVIDDSGGDATIIWRGDE